MQETDVILSSAVLGKNYITTQVQNVSVLPHRFQTDIMILKSSTPQIPNFKGLKYM